MEETNNNNLYLFSFLLIALKLSIYPFIHEVDADAISRTYLSLQFANNPHIIETGNWPPLYFYILGAALKLYSNQFFTPVFINIILSSALIFPLFNFLKRIFNNKIAFYLCIFFSFSPIVFRLSLLGMSEIPYLFFVVLSANTLSKGLIENKIGLIVISGILMSISGGIRYESWLLGVFAIITILYYSKSYKKALIFTIPFISIPIYWIISNYLNADNALNSFNWAIDSTNIKAPQSFEDFLRRIWWYPLSLIFSFGPIAFYFFIKEFKNSIKYYKTNKLKSLFVTFFFIVFTIWIINTLRGSLLLQHRFSLTLFVLAFPFLGYYFQKSEKNLFKKTLLFSLSAFLLAFVYSSKGARPIPRLLTNDAENVSKKINQHINQNSAFICDFWNWETTYYIPFSTGLDSKNIQIINPNYTDEKINESVVKMVFEHNSGVILVNNNERLNTLLKRQEHSFTLEGTRIKLNLNAFYKNDVITCYKYSILN